MVSTLTHFASDGAAGDIFTALGIDWKTLILQIVAFLILVWLLGKFVYPWLMKSVDERQKNIEEAAKAAKQAQESAAESEAETAELLATARKEAAEIVAGEPGIRPVVLLQGVLPLRGVVHLLEQVDELVAPLP